MTIKIFLKGMLPLLLAIPLYAGFEDDTPFGWASMNGGTTGGQGGSVDTVKTNNASTLQGYLSGDKKQVVFFSGKLSESSSITIGSNKTLIGMPGDPGQMSSVSIDGKNIILRNLLINGPDDDALQIKGSNNTNIWIDHCDIFDGVDGNLDITKGPDFITVSNCHFYYNSSTAPHRFSNLIASNDDDKGEYRITHAYNHWGKNVDQRGPRMRYAKTHIVNNLYTSEGNSYSIGVGYQAKPLIENNVFIGVDDPIHLRDECDPSLVKAMGNIFINTTGKKAEPNGTAFTPPYTMDIKPASEVEDYVRANAGATLTWEKVGSVIEGKISSKKQENMIDISGQYPVVNNRSQVGATVSLYTLSGRCVRKLIVDGGSRLVLNQSKINRKEFADGAYIIRLESPECTINRRVQMFK